MVSVAAQELPHPIQQPAPVVSHNAHPACHVFNSKAFIADSFLKAKFNVATPLRSRDYRSDPGPFLNSTGKYLAHPLKYEVQGRGKANRQLLARCLFL
jgi:hypothetical protein